MIADAAPKIEAAKANGKKGGRPKKQTEVAEKKPTGFQNTNPVGLENEAENEAENETERQDLAKAIQSQTSSLRSEASEANASDAEASEKHGFSTAQAEALTKEELWSAGKSLLESARVPKAQCGSFIGGLVKEFTAEVVIGVVRAAVIEVPADPRGWMRAACQSRAGQRPRQDAKTFRERDLEAKSARIAEMTGGLLGSRPENSNEIIDMEAPTNGTVATIR